MQKIMNQNKQVVAFYKKSCDWNEGLDFLTSDDQFLQVGTWFYNAGKKLDRHFHNIVSRQSDLTQECVVVIEGSMKVIVYNNDRSFLDEFTLFKGDFAVFLQGGHEYQILENNTKILETKNGPFLGVELDKTRF